MAWGPKALPGVGPSIEITIYWTARLLSKFSGYGPIFLSPTGTEKGVKVSYSSGKIYSSEYRSGPDQFSLWDFSI